MKLRNKKTGEIIDIDIIENRKDGSWEWQAGKTLHDLAENWEDVDSNNATNIPLIKDEKIRKAVLAWAEANDIDRVWHECATCWLRGNGIEIYFDKLELEQGNYSITELCGEEEECES